MRFKIARAISFFVLIICTMCIFSFVIRLAIEGNRLGALTKPLNQFSNFPRTALYALKEIANPKKYLKIDPDFKPINLLEKDILILSSTFLEDQWIIQMKNMKDDSVHHSWTLRKDNFKETNRDFLFCAPKTPILLDDSSIVIAAESSENLYRLDVSSNIIWHNTDYYYHHSINRSADGNIWACTSEPKVSYNEKLEYFKYDNNFITKIDVNTGKVLFHQSIATIFAEHGLNYLVHGVSNEATAQDTDPIHLNDIEPIYNDGPYWNKEDILFSIRNRSMIVHYRPKTNKIIRIIRGPFYHQHDVDIVNDSTISFFDNHISGLKATYMPDEDTSKHLKTQLNQFSRVLKYSLSDSTFSPVFENRFSREKVYTPTQGLHHFLGDGRLFIESTDQGTVYVFSSDQTIYRRYLHTPKNGLVMTPNWVSVVD